MKHKTYAGVDHIRLDPAACPHRLRRVAQRYGIHAVNIAGGSGGHILHHRSLRQPGHVVAAGRVAALRCNHGAQALQTSAAFQRVHELLLGIRHACGRVRQQQHARAQLQRHLQKRPLHTA